MSAFNLIERSNSALNSLSLCTDFAYLIMCEFLHLHSSKPLQKYHSPMSSYLAQSMSKLDLQQCCNMAATRGGKDAVTHAFHGQMIVPQSLSCLSPMIVPHSLSCLSHQLRRNTRRNCLSGLLYLLISRCACLDAWVHHDLDAAAPVEAALLSVRHQTSSSDQGDRNHGYLGLLSYTEGALQTYCMH